MSRITFLTFVTGFLLIACRPTSTEYAWISTGFHEPSTDGLEYIYSYDGVHWDTLAGHPLQPMVGEQRVMRDPSLICIRDTFRLVWTAGWKGDLGFGYAWSTDLVHWSDEEFIPVMQPMDTPAAQAYGCGYSPALCYDNAESARSRFLQRDSLGESPVQVWAPEWFYERDSQCAYIIWASCVPGAFPDGLEEHRNNHRLYYTTTRDFHHFTPTRLFLDPGYSVIDGTLVDTQCTTPTGAGEAAAAAVKGSRYAFVVKDNTRPCRNIKMVYADHLDGPWQVDTTSFTPLFCEGPTVVRTSDGLYRVYYDAYRAHNFGCALTRDFRTFTDVTDSVSVPAGHKHGTALRVSRKTLEALRVAAPFMPQPTVAE